MKKIFYAIAILVMSMVIMPNVYAEEANNESTLTQAITTAQTSGGTITITGNITTNDMITINAPSQTITIDLNGHTITRTGGNTVFHITNGNVTFKDDTGNGKVEKNDGIAIYADTGSNVTLNGGNYIGGGAFPAVEVNGATLTVSGKTYIEATTDIGISIHDTSTVEVKGEATIKGEKQGISVGGTGSKLTVSDNVNIEGEYGIGVFGNNSDVTIDGGNIKASSFAVSGNGSQTTNSTIKITGGNLESTGSAAIYHPQTGTLTIEGGNITGKIGIVARQGTIDIKGGKITASGNGTDSVGDATENGGKIQLPLGTAVIVDNKSNGYSTTANVTINGGDFDTTSSDPVVSLKDDENDITIEKGNFNKPVNTKYLNSDKYYVDFVIDDEHVIVVGVNKNSKINTADIPKPTKSGYSFINWYNESTFDTIFDTTSEITENKTVYARFTKNSSVTKYYVEFVVEGEDSTTIYVRSGRTIDKSDIPEYKKEGFKLDGWYLDKEYTKKFDFTTPITADITLYAKYTKDDVINENPKTSDNIITYISVGILSFGALLIARRKITE